MPRPAQIDRMGLELTGSNPTQPPENPIDILDFNGWAAIPVKNVQGSYPLNCYVDDSFPNYNLSFWMIPGLACNLVLYTWQPLVTFPDLNTDVTFPPAYALAIKNNLAILLGAEFKSQPDPIVIETARISLATIKDMNLPQPILNCESPTSRGGFYDWRSNSYIVRR